MDLSKMNKMIQINVINAVWKNIQKMLKNVNHKLRPVSGYKWKKISYPVVTTFRKNNDEILCPEKLAAFRL